MNEDQKENFENCHFLLLKLQHDIKAERDLNRSLAMTGPSIVNALAFVLNDYVRLLSVTTTESHFHPQERTMGFGITPPNNTGGSKPHTGGATPGPKARGSDPTPPNETGGNRKDDEQGRVPSTAGGTFVSPPNESAPSPGRGGKM